jgi:hypothetical protein
MSEKGKRWVLDEKTGKFKEGKAKPKLLREDLRKLPSEWVTDEVQDGSRIHEDDPEHVREALVDDLVEAERSDNPVPNAVEAVLQLADAPLSERVVPLSQWRIDAVRLRVIFALIENARVRAKKGKTVNLEVRHLRFPTNNIHGYELRPGPPPAPSKLHPHERGFKLWVDPFNWPPDLTEALKKAGVDIPNLENEESLYRAYRLKLSEERIKRDESF